MKKLLLASSSPRRQEILRKLGISFEVIKPECDENYPKNIRGAKIPVYLAEKKILSILESKKERNDYLIAADTVVIFKGRVMGKPSDRNEAFRFLKQMQGKTHLVVTGLSFYSPKTNYIEKTFAKTKVTFRKLSDGEINWYLGTDEWKDAAGGYKIQEKGAFLVKKICGSYSNVVGLPISELYDILFSHGFMSEA